MAASPMHLLQDGVKFPEIALLFGHESHVITLSDLRKTAPQRLFELHYEFARDRWGSLKWPPGFKAPNFTAADYCDQCQPNTHAY